MARKKLRNGDGEFFGRGRQGEEDKNKFFRQRLNIEGFLTYNFNEMKSRK